MTTFTSGTKVQVTSHYEDKFVGVVGTVDFQCAPTLGVEGLIYINWVPKGKRKEVSKAFHSSHLTVV